MIYGKSIYIPGIITKTIKIPPTRWSTSPTNAIITNGDNALHDADHTESYTTVALGSDGSSYFDLLFTFSQLPRSAVIEQFSINWRLYGQNEGWSWGLGRTARIVRSDTLEELLYLSGTGLWGSDPAAAYKTVWASTVRTADTAPNIQEHTFDEFADGCWLRFTARAAEQPAYMFIYGADFEVTYSI